MYKYEIKEKCFHKKLGIQSAPVEVLAPFLFKAFKKD